MQRVFRSGLDLSTTIERENRGLWLRLAAGRGATPEAATLREVNHEPNSGSKPLLTLESPSNERFVFKLAAPELLAAEVAAFELKNLAGRPCIPAKLMELNLPERGAVKGLLKPFVEWDAASELSTDTRQWTVLQRHVMLMEHAWEWFLDNLDSNAGQFALLGDKAFPLNIDWDRAFAQDGVSELSRFAKYRGTLPSARTFLYTDYVEGRIDLSLNLMLREARLIRELPRAGVVKSVQAYAEVRYSDANERMQFVTAVLARQVGVERAFRNFAKALLAERATFRKARDPRGIALSVSERLRFQQSVIWNATQPVLHDISHGFAGRAARQLLKRLRGMDAQAPAE